MMWTDEMDAILLNMRNGGFSSSKIADHLNMMLKNGEQLLSADAAKSREYRITRNAVIGRAHRLVANGKCKPIESKKGVGKYSRADPPKPKPVTIAKLRHEREPKPVTLPPVAPVQRELPPVLTVMVSKPKPRSAARPVPLMELTGCKWPVNDPSQGEEHLFCNADPKVDKPYCDDHCKLAYTGRQRVDRESRKKLLADWRF